MWRMAMTSVWVNIDGRGVACVLHEAAGRLEGNEHEIVVDFASVQRIDLDALRAMEGLASAADENSATVVLVGVSVEVYKVLKLMKLASRFSYAPRDLSEAEKELSRHAESCAK
jgi:anti-anti-sigma regulatory factor